MIRTGEWLHANLASPPFNGTYGEKRTPNLGPLVGLDVGNISSGGGSLVLEFPNAGNYAAARKKIAHRALGEGDRSSEPSILKPRRTMKPARIRKCRNA